MHVRHVAKFEEWKLSTFASIFLRVGKVRNMTDNAKLGVYYVIVAYAAIWLSQRK